MAVVTIQSPLVSVDWLNEHQFADNLIILDASIPKVTGTVDDTPKIKIPKSQFFDIKKSFSDTNASFPNTLPSAEQFQNAARQLGINTDSAIVVYDNLGIYSSPRAWWLFKTFGHHNIAVLDGGLPEWIHKEFQTADADSDDSIDISGNFQANYKQHLFTDFEGIAEHIDNESSIIIDSRSSARFNSEVPEPRKGVRSGHIKNSVNLPYSELLDSNKLQDIDKIKRIFNTLVGTKDTLVMSCGTGITACVSALAATIGGYKDIIVYDGSWTEYGTLTN